MNHLLDWQDIEDALWSKLVERTVEHAQYPTWNQTAAGKSLGMVFFNPSLRTRTSMELAAAQLGAFTSTLTPGQGTWGFKFGPGKMDGAEAEHIVEAIGVLSRYYDALGVRLFASGTDLEADRAEVKMREIMQASIVPVINLESAYYHPCQALADAATIHEHFKGQQKKKRFVLAWAHHPKPLPMAVPNSALLQAARQGMDVVVARPESHALDPAIMDLATQTAAKSGGALQVTEDLEGAMEGAAVVYAKAWGGPMVYHKPENEAAHRLAGTNWQITAERMRKTDNGVFMHCLPVRRDVVVASEVLESSQALHLRQAHHRLFAQKAILEAIWGLI
ncbi:MAG: N-acetylornithine carbamoyltransferase [Bacteroidetes Order II. Incertae sedis bacterium]|nr:N-acetylornithine carbamoyltransferase [Bacteroidetes Order II. bacterium]